MEAMQKLDAKLVDYLTGDQFKSTQTCVENVEPKPLTLKKMEQLCSSNSSSSSQQHFEANNAGVAASLAGSGETLYDLFSRMSGIKLQLEALTLQPDGTKRMELLQNDIRPFFTVECQLSHELIKSMPRYDMFHIMQFESEKFQSLTQCTRFGQEAVRAVKLEGNNNDMLNNNVNGAEAKPNFGRIHFTVWWREPGTCLNEMLGMGVLALEELYAASVLEQCKRIVIQRRKEHLANLYLKVSVQVNAAADSHHEIATAIAQKQQQESLNMGNEGNTDSATNGNGTPTVTGEYVVAAVHNSSMTGRMRVEDTKIQ